MRIRPCCLWVWEIGQFAQSFSLFYFCCLSILSITILNSLTPAGASSNILLNQHTTEAPGENPGSGVTRLSGIYLG